MNRYPRERRDAIRPRQHDDHPRRTATDSGEDPVPRRRLAAKVSAVSSMAVEGWID